MIAGVNRRFPAGPSGGGTDAATQVRTCVSSWLRETSSMRSREHLDGADADNNRLGNFRGIVVDEPEIVLASQLRQAHRASAPSHALRKRVQAVQLLGLKSGDDAAAALEQPFAQRGFRRRVFRRSRHFCASAKTLHGALEAVAQPREIKARLAASRKTLLAHQALHQRNPTLRIRTERGIYPLFNEAFRVRRALVAFALSCARADSHAEIYARSPRKRAAQPIPLRAVVAPAHDAQQRSADHIRLDRRKLDSLAGTERSAGKRMVNADCNGRRANA